MAENKIEKLAEILEIEIDKPFYIKGYAYNPCKLTHNRIINNHGVLIYSTIFQLLTGELEIEKPILDDVEKRYLENVLRPFKDRVIYIEKAEYEDFDYEYLIYRVSLPVKRFGYECCSLPLFDKCSMYKGMECGKRYSLKELGLFEGDGDEDVK